MKDFKECEGCVGWCCAGFSYTPLRNGEAEKIAQHLNMSLEEFKSEYSGTFRIHHTANGITSEEIIDTIRCADPCPFWEGPFNSRGDCKINSVKPTACKKYLCNSREAAKLKADKSIARVYISPDLLRGERKQE